GATATATLSISADNFVLTAPASAAQVNLNTPQTVTVHWDQAGTPQVNQTINFFATRGDYAANACINSVGPTTCAITNNNGDATVTISADNAGPEVISAAANV